MNGLLAGEEGAVGDDVLLHLGGAGADRRVALERVQARPRAAVDGIGAALGEQPRRSEQVDRQLGERLSQVAPLQLRQRDLGPVLLALDDLGQRPVVEELRVLDVRERPGDALTDLGIAQRVRVGGLGGRDHRAQVRRHRDREPGGADALVPERAHRDLPALAFLAEPAVGRDAGVGEPHLVEELVAGDVADRAAFDPRRVHVDDKRGDALVLDAALDRLRVRPQQEQAPVGEMRRRDPDLLAIHCVLVAVADGCRAQVGQVGAGFRLAEPLAPVLRRVEDAGQPTLLLLVGAPLDDHGADLPDAVGVVDARRAHARILLGVDDVLDRRRLAPTPVLGPVDRGPPALVEPALPVLPALLAARDARLHPAGAAAARGSGGLADRCRRAGARDGARREVLVAAPVGEELRQVLLQPSAQLVAERDVLGGVSEIHRANTNIRVRFLGRALTVGFHLQRRPRRAARDRPRVPRARGARRVRARDGRRRARLHRSGVGQARRARVARAARPRRERRARPRARRHGGRDGGDGSPAVPGTILLVGRVRDARCPPARRRRPARAAGVRCRPGHGRARGAGPRRPRRPRAHTRSPQGRRLGAHRPQAARARRPYRRLGGRCRPHRGGPRVVPARGSTWRDGANDGPDPQGPRGDQTALWRRVVDDASVMLAAELVGACDAALQLATDYAKARVQFDRPIATFQAIRHKAVDMLHQLELARVGTHYAAWASDVDDPSRERAAAMAKGFVAEAAVFISGEDIQIHGGVGFTWDCDAHLYYKRAKMNDAMLGYQGWQRRRLADLVLDGA